MAGHCAVTESPLWESNPRHQPYHGCALPTELRGQVVKTQPRRDALEVRTLADPEMIVPARQKPLRRKNVGIEVRAAAPADAEEVRAIYNTEVMGSTVTFDLVPRSLHDQLEWQARHSGAHPAIVAVRDGAVLGFASLSAYRDRPAYSTTVED